jgi:hypothetical protein
MYVGSSNLLRRRMEYYFKDLPGEARFPYLRKLPMSGTLTQASKTSLPTEGAGRERSVGKFLPLRAPLPFFTNKFEKKSSEGRY